LLYHSSRNLRPIRFFLVLFSGIDTSSDVVLQSHGELHPQYPSYFP
jgi:hypothetical protein